MIDPHLSTHFGAIEQHGAAPTKVCDGSVNLGDLFDFVWGCSFMPSWMCISHDSLHPACEETVHY